METRRVLVTGASSGLGREMALQLARAGCRVAITGRRKDKLDETARLMKEAGAAQTLAFVEDVTDPAAVKRDYESIRASWEGLDWAILNAGVGDSSNARTFSAENVRWTFATNVFGIANWMEALIPDMIARGSGTIAGISSVAGARGLPNSGAYSASKAAVNALLESARVDLRGTGVNIVTVCPGFVKSEMTDRNDPSDMWFLLEVEDGARRILDGIAASRRIVHFPWPLSVPTLYLLPLLPGWLYDRIGARIKRRKKPYIDQSASRSS